MDYKKEYKRYQDAFESYLQSEVAKLQGHKILVEAMKYSLIGGGKRVRPVLMMASCEAFGGKIEDCLPYALALECVHSSSLIHDDLPALDNDFLRRGKPTNHRVFGENIAILAGDALLNYAFEICLQNSKTMKEIEISKYIAESSGYKGMLGGQASDVRRIIGDDEAQLLDLDLKKTSKLFTAALVGGAIIADGNRAAMETFGEKLGVIYQFVDDLLDVTGTSEDMGKTVNKDANLGKLTAVSVYGKEGVVSKISEMVNACVDSLKNVPNSEFLHAFLDESVKRES